MGFLCLYSVRTVFIMLKYFPLLLLGLSLVSCAQSRKSMDSRAFFRQSFGGARISTTDMNGNETVKGADTVHIIYLQFKKDDGPPVIDTIFIGQKAFTAKAQQLSEKDLLVGTARWTDSVVRLGSSDRSSWWKFELLRIEGVYDVNRTGQNILVKGHLKGRSFLVSINDEMELKPGVRM